MRNNICLRGFPPNKHHGCFLLLYHIKCASPQVHIQEGSHSPNILLSAYSVHSFASIVLDSGSLLLASIFSGEQEARSSTESQKEGKEVSQGQREGVEQSYAGVRKGVTTEMQYGYWVALRVHLRSIVVKLKMSYSAATFGCLGAGSIKMKPE